MKLNNIPILYHLKKNLYHLVFLGVIKGEHWREVGYPVKGALFLKMLGPLFLFIILFLSICIHIFITSWLIDNYPCDVKLTSVTSGFSRSSPSNKRQLKFKRAFLENKLLPSVHLRKFVFSRYLLLPQQSNWIRQL